jgi:hypothetical protein
MGHSNAIVQVEDRGRALYARLADGEALSEDEVRALDAHVIAELRARAERNHRRLVEESGTMRLMTQ